LTALLRRLVWATDFSELSLESAGYAASLAEHLHAKLFVVHVFEPRSMPDKYASADREGRVNPDMAALDVCRDRLSRLVADRFARLEVVEAKVLFGEPWQAICGYAGEVGADLILVSRSGGAGFRHALLGSTAERVVRHAPCPVLVIKSPRVGGATGNSTRRDATGSESPEPPPTDPPASGTVGGSA
jgi:universal stress protein A